MNWKEEINFVVNNSIRACMPYKRVKDCLNKLKLDKNKRYILIGIGKASYSMALGAIDSKISFDSGIIISNYGNIKKDLKNIKYFEASHPILDDNTILATKEVLKLLRNLSKKDVIIFLISGGASSLFELPLISLQELKNINKQLINSGANIKEINTIRKRLSYVKGGKFAKYCKPAKIYNIILSDVIDNRLDMIASGPSNVDLSSFYDIKNITNKYNLTFSKRAKKLLKKEAVKELCNVENILVASVKDLCVSAKKSLSKLGYETFIISSKMSCFAKDAGIFVSSLARNNVDTKKDIAFIFGGECVVDVKGNGLGGRNQEIVSYAIKNISGLDNVLILSYSSDGIDGNSDAAGGLVYGDSLKKIREKNLNLNKFLENNDSYNLLKKINQLIITGNTGTNVNDLTIILIRAKK